MKWGLRFVTALGVAVLLSACSGNSGADTEQNPGGGGGGGSGGNYNGPPPKTSDIQRFYQYFWTELVGKCGQCHTDGGQAPAFVRDDDINAAYSDAITIVNLAEPNKSRIVEKVSGGHNCWVSNPVDCADQITNMITRWAGSSGDGAANEVQLTPISNPTEPGQSRGFPASPSLFEQHVWTPYLRPNCAGCHSPDAATPQQPFFAAADINTAYAAVKSKIDLDDPARSRLVIRLRSEFHNCWTGSCMDDSNEMQDGIEAMAAGIALSELDPDLVPSRAMTLVEGIVASSGGRFEQNMIALWQFKTGTGQVAYDTSGISPAVDLNLYGDISWVGGWGIKIRGDDANPSKAQAPADRSRKIYDFVQASGEYSIEAWVAPDNVVQDNASRIVAYTGGTESGLNFALGQSTYNYDFLQRMSSTDANGMPITSTPDADELAQAALQHVVITYDPINGRKIYVNGVDSQNNDSVAAGTLGDWDENFAFVLGNEPSNNRQWQGIIKLVAVHNRALTPTQITQNFNAGVGERYYLLFSVSHLIDGRGCIEQINDNGTTRDIHNCYIVMEVSQYDSYGYLFNTPFFAAMKDTIDLSDIPVSKMRIGINGKEAPVGQVYAKMDTTLADPASVDKSRHNLSELGTVVTVEKGPSGDEFFLTFERLGVHENVVIEAEPPTPPAPADLEPVSDIGVRTFDQINATMSSITGIPRTNSNVVATFTSTRQSLPAIPDIQAFLSSHQMAITQLAIAYCDQLVESSSARATFFPGFNFSAPIGSAFSGGNTDLILNPLLNRITSNNLGSQPLDTDVRAELNLLINGGTQVIGADTVNYPGLKNTVGTTTTGVVKGACAAALGSAAMLVQ